MVSKTFEDYEVLSILGSDIYSSYYKVKHKATSEIYVWKAFSLDNLQEDEKNTLLENIKRRKDETNPYLLKFYDFIIYDSKVLYLIMQYCEYGNLYAGIRKCIENKAQIHENFIIHIIYQLTSLVKANGVQTTLNIKNVFVDKNFDIKLLNFEQENTPNIIFDICSILYQLITLSTDKLKENVEVEVSHNYSSNLRNMLQCFRKEYTEWTFETLLCHPLFLTQRSLDSYYQDYDEKPTETKHNKQNHENHKLEIKLQNYYRRESNLKSHEAILKEKEYELIKRERKVALMERIVKEKMARAEVYLKNSQNSKANKSNKQSTYQKLDSSFSADCGDTSIMPTSTKMYSPSRKGLIRSVSEKRIKFRGHSPLKDVHYHRSKKALSTNDIKVLKEKAEDKSKGMSLNKRMSRLFIKEKNLNNDSVEKGCRPISWTEENKRHAFELLKFMNTDEKNNDIKHTFM